MINIELVSFFHSINAHPRKKKKMSLLTKQKKTQNPTKRQK